MSLKNLKLVRKRELSAFRKIAIATWHTVGDPSVYGTIELRVDRALEYLDAFHRKWGKRATMTHLVAKAAAAALRATPEANAILRFDRLYLREDVSVFFQVAMTDRGPDKIDLSGLVLHGVDEKSLAQICDEFHEQVELVRHRKDKTFEPSRQRMRRFPALLLRWSLEILSFVAYSLNLNPTVLGVPRDAFGSLMITNVGSLGLDIAYPPLVPYARVPILLAIGVVRDAPVVEDGRVVAAKLMNVSVTFDHRFIDGVHAAKMAAVLRAWIGDPFAHFDPIDGGESDESAAT